jgi:hypothetical protein
MLTLMPGGGAPSFNTMTPQCLEWLKGHAVFKGGRGRRMLTYADVCRWVKGHTVFKDGEEGGMEIGHVAGSARDMFVQVS